MPPLVIKDQSIWQDFVNLEQQILVSAKKVPDHISNVMMAWVLLHAQRLVKGLESFTGIPTRFAF